MEFNAIQELKTKRAALGTQIQNKNIENRDKEATPEMMEELRKMEVAFDALNEQVDAEERNLTRMRNLGEIAKETPKDKSEEREMKAFEKFIRTGDLKEYRDLSVGTSYSGIELIPTILGKSIIGLMRDTGAMRKISKVMFSGSNQDIPIESAALTGYWVYEATTITASSPTFATISLKGNKMGAITKVSNELLADSAFDIPNFLATNMAEVFAQLAEAEYIYGTLSGRPTGLDSDATLGLTSSVTGSLDVGDAMDLYTSVLSGYRDNGTWLIADNLLGTFMTMADTANTAHSLYTLSSTPGTPDKFLGKPIYTSSKVTTAATTTHSVFFGDFSKYIIMDRGPLQIQRLDELYAAADQTGFKGILRTDGHLLQALAVKYIKCL